MNSRPRRSPQLVGEMAGMILTTVLLVVVLRQLVGPSVRPAAAPVSSVAAFGSDRMKPRMMLQGDHSEDSAGSQVTIAGGSAGEPSADDQAGDQAGAAEQRVKSPMLTEGASNGRPLVAAPSSAARGLVTGLLELDLAAGRLTEEGVSRWKRHFQALGEAGPAGVAAIQEFLRRNQDYDLTRVAGAEELGYPSLRLALFDSLQQIGGSAAGAVLLETLQTTADPREVALLAQYLESVEPGGHREAAIEAARQSLAMASSGELKGIDMSPAFEVLQKYGDAQVAEHLVAASQLWGYYGTLALAGLPEGAGLPALVQVATASAQGGAGRTEFAWSLLAQAASGNPDAAGLLLEQARGNKIPDTAWPAVAEGLAGFRARFESGVWADGSSKSPISSDAKRYHIAVGNQNYVSEPPAHLTPEEVQQRTALLQQFLALNPGPTASAALQGRVEWLGQNAGR